MKLNKLLFSFLVICSLGLPLQVLSQTVSGGLKGVLFNEKSGAPVLFASLMILETKDQAISDYDGYYSFSKIDTGDYILRVTSVGYDTTYVDIIISKNTINSKNVYLRESSTRIGVIKITEKGKDKKVKTQIGKTTIDQRQLQRLPTVGGEADLVQYLQVLPGVVFTGDQGGQLYIRGGSPVMNKVLLDGMTIYNPFHSIGLFSVFDADLIKTADVYSAGFGAEYGGRVSAVVDVKTRDGDRTRFRGKVAVNPFTSKILLEGPLKKFKRNESNSSFAISYKTSYLDKSSKLFYDYADPSRMPYSFSDFYGKLAFNSPSGSNSKFYGFNFNDKVDFENSTKYNWKSSGFGGRFLLLPSGSKTRIDAVVAYSGYKIEQEEEDSEPRESGINGFNIGLNFGYKIKRDNLKFGIEMNGFSTDYRFRNSYDRLVEQKQNTTEIGAFSQYSIVKRRFVVEMGLRAQYYASLADASFEPRLAVKYLITPEFRLKAATGIYSQNLISANSDRDVVNLFYGFLSGPEDLPSTFNGKKVTHKLQKSNHFVAGIELDLGTKHEINIEGYLKDFTQITNINREKIFDDNGTNSGQPDRLKRDYIIETGRAYGVDFTYKFENKQFYFWAVYSLNYVTRNDEFISYSPHFDRRHNVNLVGSIYLNKKRNAEFNVRWNFGSGFPFTETQGFYEKLQFAGGISGDYTVDNGDLGVYYKGLNEGRLPYFHRMDVSFKKAIELKKDRKLEIVASITNVYDRENIFYFDRVNYERVNQLPILPSLGASYSF
jgi:hypothetical protein